MTFAVSPAVTRAGRPASAALARLIVAARSPREFRTEGPDLAFCDAAQVLGRLSVLRESVDELHQLVVGHRTRVWKGVHGFEGCG